MLDVDTMLACVSEAMVAIWLFKHLHDIPFCKRCWSLSHKQGIFHVHATSIAQPVYNVRQFAHTADSMTG